MKIEDTRISMSKSEITKAVEIKIGTVFTCRSLRENDYTGPFLRTYNGIVDLSNPNSTWEIIDLVRKGPEIEGFEELNVKLVIL